ncbi:MAG: glycosyltransferase family A protein [Rhodothermales bacterium]
MNSILELQKARSTSDGASRHDDVTFVMPIYDRLRFFAHYLDEGLWDGLPLQIICDGASPAVLDDLHFLTAGRPDIRVHHYETNRGVACARGEGMRLVDTPYLAFCDDDDFLNEADAFLEESTAWMDRDETILFTAMPAVYAFNESLQIGLQYDRRGFDGKTGFEVLCYLVATGEMQVLTLGSLFRPPDLRGTEPEPFFKVSEDYVFLARLCARYPERRVRVARAGRYMRLVQHQQGSLSGRSGYSLDKIVMHLVSMCVGAAYLMDMGRLTLPLFTDLLRKRGEVLQTSYTRGRQAAGLVADLLAGHDPVAASDEAAEALRVLERSRDGLPPEFLRLAGWA